MVTKSLTAFPLPQQTNERAKAFHGPAAAGRALLIVPTMESLRRNIIYFC
jgi:hypothetical protein